MSKIQAKRTYPMFNGHISVQSIVTSFLVYFLWKHGSVLRRKKNCFGESLCLAFFLNVHNTLRTPTQSAFISSQNVAIPVTFENNNRRNKRVLLCSKDYGQFMKDGACRFWLKLAYTVLKNPRPFVFFESQTSAF